uniref:WAT1-related protein n=1 Tax=Aegilops tauschii subsp. strangulata TaxID=200361 RepID=A0A453DHJ7_AEGTS
MESLQLKRFHGIMKVSGIVLCAAGVTVLTLYQGPELKSVVHYPLFHHASQVDTHPSRSWILGILLQSLATVLFALWTVVQVCISLCAQVTDSSVCGHVAMLIYSS